MIKNDNARKRDWIFAALALGFLLAVFFFPVIFLGKVLAPLDILDHLLRPWSDGAGGFGVHNAFIYDAVSQYLPYNWAVCQSLKQDGFIGWNPWCFGGYALLENTMLCPGDWHHQLYRVFDFWTAWDLGIVLQFAIAAFGILAMLRAEKIPAWAALVGAIAYAFYSQHILWIYHRWVLGTSCWFPWIVWSVRRARQRDRLLGIGAVVFTGLAFRGGHLQSCLFTVTLVACLFAAEILSWRTSATRRNLLRILCFYGMLAVLSSALAADVILDTIPPYLEGCKKLPPESVLQSLSGIPTFVTAFLPNALGMPQSLDGFKLFGDDLFDLKYLGLLPLSFALLALIRRDAPVFPKILFFIGLGTAFTPLVRWFYSRSTVVFCLGATWLSAWMLTNLASVSRRQWKWAIRLSAIALAVWIIAGISICVFSARIEPLLHSFVKRTLPATKSTRLAWMLARSDVFLSSFPPWSKVNLPLIALDALGLFAAWKLSAFGDAVRRTRLILMTVLIGCVFGESFVWSRTWITFSAPPSSAAVDGDLLYPTPKFAQELRSEMHNRGMLWIHGTRPDFDYFQLNTQSGIGIPSLQGYETIKPRTLQSPPEATDYDPGAFAERGVSHVLVLPGAVPPPGLSAWNEVIATSALHLFRNPTFDSRWHAILSDDSSVPLTDKETSPNRHSFELPIGTLSVRLAEPFHPAWTDVVSGTNAPGVQATRAADGGTIVAFDRPLEAPATLVRSFRKRNRLLYPQLAILLLLAFRSRMQKCKGNRLTTSVKTHSPESPFS